MLSASACLMIKGNFPVEKFKNLQTPFYYYDTDLLKKTLDTISGLMQKHPEYRMHYAIKANANPELLRLIAMKGFGADCVSGGEVQAAIDAGFNPREVVYAGVGKSDAEINLALKHKIGSFNVESEAELEVIAELAAKAGVVADICLRINPDVGAHTHSNITTGLAENKFGINKEQMEEVVCKAASLPSINFRGLHFHIGSQILDMMDFVALCNRINELQQILSAAGIEIRDINVGGGLGIDYYHPNHKPIADFESYFKVFEKHLKLNPGQLLHFELGRSIIAPCGTLISKVLYVKKGTFKQFAILDAGMNDLIRPALYHAYHRIENISSDGAEEIYDVVGPVCESSDTFAKEASLNKVNRGDLIAIRSAGAYGEVMCMRYNCKPFPNSYFDYKLF